MTEPLTACPYCQSPVNVYQEHPDHPGWYAECSSQQQCVVTWTCFSREEAEEAWMRIKTTMQVFGTRVNKHEEETEE
jgi:hypothetical protein